jgi:hypothetical protein
MNDNKDGGITIQKKHIIIAVIIIILLLVGGITLGANWNKWFGDKQPDTTVSETEDSSKPSIELDENAGEYTGEKPKDQGSEEVGIKIPGYPSITIAADSKNVTMALLNPEGNPCYFKFEIVLKDTDETIFESKYVEPGKAITDVELKRPLSAGEYPAIIKISTLSLDGSSPMNGANVETVLAAK